MGRFKNQHVQNVTLGQIMKQDLALLDLTPTSIMRVMVLGGIGALFAGIVGPGWMILIALIALTALLRQRILVAYDPTLAATRRERRQTIGLLTVGASAHELNAALNGPADDARASLCATVLLFMVIALVHAAPQLKRTDVDVPADTTDSPAPFTESVDEPPYPLTATSDISGWDPHASTAELMDQLITRYDQLPPDLELELRRAFHHDDPDAYERLMEQADPVYANLVVAITAPTCDRHGLVVSAHRMKDAQECND